MFEPPAPSVATLALLTCLTAGFMGGNIGNCTILQIAAVAFQMVDALAHIYRSMCGLCSRVVPFSGGGVVVMRRLGGLERLFGGGVVMRRLASCVVLRCSSAVSSLLGCCVVFLHCRAPVCRHDDEQQNTCCHSYRGHLAGTRPVST